MSNLFPYLLQRAYVTRSLDVVKMRDLMPCDVDNPQYGYAARIVDIVLDPLRIEEVNRHFIEEGFSVDEGMQVIAKNEDGSILLWGGFNSIFHLRKGERISGAFDENHLAFDDILDLTARFKIKNKKPEIDALLAQLTAKYADRE
jgi:hypothetical protein